MKVTLKVIEGPHLGTEFSFDQYASFVVGRHRKSQFWLSLKDPYLSRLHFYLEIKPPQCVLVDLHSSNHTYVNSQRTDQAFLSDGDLIRAGDTTLRLLIEPGPPPPPPQPIDRDSRQTFRDIASNVCSVQETPGRSIWRSTSAIRLVSR